MTAFSRAYHRFYLWAQRRQTWSKRLKDPSFRTLRHIAFVERHLPRPWPEPVLCLGPRNWIELARLREAGCSSVLGLDLISTSSDIHVGDMHAMPFEANRFGLIWASHVIEHAREPKVVFGEIVRVLKPGGRLFVAYPTDFRVNWHDRHDYGDPIWLPSRVLAPRLHFIASMKTENKGTAEWAALFQT